MTTIRLHWNDTGHARDDATGLSLQVERNGIDPAYPWVWFITDMPVFPDRDQSEDRRHGRAPTEVEAKLAAEAGLPSVDELRAFESGSESAWVDDHTRRKRD